MENTNEYRLPKDFATKWIAALRYGGFKQGKGKLLLDGCSCCLGVAGIVCGIPTQELNEWSLLREDRWSMPVPVELHGYGNTNTLVGKLVELNDYSGKSFSEIADWIEANVTLY